MRRFLAAACAASLCNVLFYPLDTYKVQLQLGSKNTRAPYAGLLTDTTGTFLATANFFLVYDGVETPVVGATIGTCAAVVTNTPFSVSKRRSQIRRNKFVDRLPRQTRWTYTTCFISSLVNKIPTQVVKYSIYEVLMPLFLVYMPRHLAGFFGALIASVSSSIIGFPIDARRTRFLAGHVKPRGHYSKGMWISMFHSIFSNAVGHALMEEWTERSFSPQKKA